MSIIIQTNITVMKVNENIGLGESYESPEAFVHTIFPEGMLCVSGSNDSFEEDDSWIELLDND